MSVGSIKTHTIGDGRELIGDGTYIRFQYNPADPPGSSMDYYVEQRHVMSMNPKGGVLHGQWESDATVTTSDRRLKTSIEPLYRTIAARAKARWGDTEEAPAPAAYAAPSLRGTGSSQKETTVAAPTRQQDQPIGWLLRELRPVSFKLKSGPEAKYLKFGFIAQELETIFPNLVRTSDSEQGTKSIAQQDLIAVLTLAIQNIQKEQQEQREWMQRVIHEQQNALQSTQLALKSMTEDIALIKRALFAPRV